MISIIIPAGSRIGSGSGPGPGPGSGSGSGSGGSDCVDVTATDDTFLEGDEQFDITITGTNIAEVTVGEPSTITVNITDLDGTMATIATFYSSLIKPSM